MKSASDWAKELAEFDTCIVDRELIEAMSRVVREVQADALEAAAYVAGGWAGAIADQIRNLKPPRSAASWTRTGGGDGTHQLRRLPHCEWT